MPEIEEARPDEKTQEEILEILRRPVTIDGKEPIPVTLLSGCEWNRCRGRIDGYICKDGCEVISSTPSKWR